MTEAEFWSGTPRYFAARRKAWIGTEERAWERARFVAFFVVKTVDSKNKFRKFADLCPFPWEAEKRPQFAPLTPEEIEEMEKFSREADELMARIRAEKNADGSR
jgi:hypothetical protein